MQNRTVVTDASGRQGVLLPDGEVFYPAEYESIDFDTMYLDELSSVIVIRLRKADGTCEVEILAEEVKAY